MLKLKKNAKLTGEKNELSPELKRYKSIIMDAPSRKKITVYIFATIDEAIEAQKRKDRTYPYKAVVKARESNGRFAAGWALICCK